MVALSARALSARLTDWRGAGPAYRALADRIRLLIVDGGIAPGSRLPAERELAAELGVSRTTIAAAYQALRDADVIASVRGSGSVARLPGRGAPADPAAGTLDLSMATMPAIPGLEPAYREAAADLAGELGGAGFDPVGIPALRAAIADRYTARGLPTTPGEIMVTVGAQHAISLVARTVLARGDRVLVENPSYPHAIDALTAAGGRLLGVPVLSDDGWDADALAETLARGAPTAAYLMPDNHNPTGRTMPTELLERTLGDAAAQGVLVIVDETMAELTIDGPTRPPAAAFGPAVLIGSVGKTVWGGVRLGWIRAEPALLRRLVRARYASDLGTPLLEQLLVTRLLDRFDDILRERVALLAAGRDHLLGALAERFPEWRVPVPGGGLTAWVGLGAERSTQLALEARARGLVITAGPRFSVDGAFDRFLRIPFSHPAPTTDAALDVLREAWDAVRDRPARGVADELVPVV